MTAYWKENETLLERYELMRGRLADILAEKEPADGADARAEAVQSFGKELAPFGLLLCEICELAADGKLRNRPAAELAEGNRRLYEPIRTPAYETSFANPAYAVARLGKTVGRTCAAAAAELRAMIPHAFAGERVPLTYALELFVEIYNLLQDGADAPAVRRALFYYVHDYCGEYLEARMFETRCPDSRFYYDIVMGESLEDNRYLYLFGEYVSETELGMADFLRELPEETVASMADTFVDGYVRGFTTMGMDFSKKTIVELRTAFGFERVTRLAIRKFEAMGKQVVLFPQNQKLIGRRYGRPSGVYGTSANPQYDYDHRNDLLLVLNRRLLEVYRRMLRKSYERYAEPCRLYAGPAVQETFGEPGFEPAAKEAVITADERLKKLLAEKAVLSSQIGEEFLPSDEISFTIIAYPVPSIGPKFPEIFRETIRVNTLDNEAYRKIQQNIIDVLDQGKFVHIQGAGANETDLTVALYDLNNPSAETIFENCTADVNIPLGEVFTSPKLTGTNGLLHVSQVYLDGNCYRDLRVRFKDGMISDYSCGNFPTEEENRQYFRENVMKNRDTLPMGEFAIGTNTTAYRMAREFDIQKVLPILIAEKTGPHFAVGDTCYSHAEDHRVYNPNGKEIVARDNELVRLRDTEPEKAYFQCHTDITIPYDELESITVLCADGRKLPVIAGGKFVVPGTELLNENIK